jgi:hypothetical protein
MNDRRQTRRRTIPFLRGGVLQVAEREHIVTIVDLGPEGAFLATRVDVPADQPLRLKTVLPRSGRQVALPCEVVWSNNSFDPATGRPAGMAVRFLLDDPAIRSQLEVFSEEGPFPSPATLSMDRYEYRLIEVTDIDADELNRLGRDGWLLSTALPQGASWRLILLRKL